MSDSTEQVKINMSTIPTTCENGQSAKKRPGDLEESASFGQPKREVATIPPTCWSSIDDGPTFACDPDHAVCDCARTWHDSAAMKVLMCRIDLARSRTRGNSGDSRHCLECLQCGVRWLVWRTETAWTFWPSATAARHMPTEWPCDVHEVEPVKTTVGLFVARRAVVFVVGEPRGLSMCCRVCGGAMARSWPPICDNGCERFYAPRCLCGQCTHTTISVDLCGLAWAARQRHRDIAPERIQSINELRGASTA